MAVFITDTQGLGLRRNIVWALLLVLSCIDYAFAAAPEKVAITVASATDTSPQVVDTLYRFTTGLTDVTLTCTPSGTGNVDPNLGYRFMKDGTVLGNWQKGDNKILTTAYAAASCGNYTCEARETQADNSPSTTSSPITLTLVCADNDDCGANTNITTCDKTSTQHKEHCKCKVNGVFSATTCDECTSTNPATHCGANAKCEGSPTKCKCTYSKGTAPWKCLPECAAPKDCTKDPKRQCHAGKCVACLANNTGCVATSTTPRCEIADSKDPVCKGCDNDQFCEKISKDKPVCDTKKGSCKAKDKTSDAATVTSTACLVIASVVVALMI